MQVLQQAGVEGFQIQAMDAVVCALWALCRHWQDPRAATIAAVRGALAQFIKWCMLRLQLRYDMIKS